MFLNSSILDVILTLHHDKSCSALQPGCRYYLCRTDALQQVCDTGSSQGALLYPAGECQAHAKCRAHTDPLPSNLQPNQNRRKKTVLADCKLLTRVTQRAARGRAGKAPHTLSRMATMPLQSSCDRTNAALRGWPSTWHSWALLLGTKQ